MGADAPIPPIMISVAAPDGAPPRRVSKTMKIHLLWFLQKHLAPPCLEEALRRGAIVNICVKNRT
jgi:hypothetical protein